MLTKAFPPIEGRFPPKKGGFRRYYALLPVAILALFSSSWSGKQRIIVRLKEPLKAETVRIQLPELTNGRGETRDLETSLELGNKSKAEGPKNQQAALKLNMVLRPAGKNAVQVTLTLPNPGYAEITLMDFYGKNLATLAEGQYQSGTFVLPPFTYKEGEHNGIHLVALRLNGKVVLKRVLTKVK